jgi:signal transduction protein with GAF and PtsI domain
MHEALDLFLSLPTAIQTQLRAMIKPKDPNNARKLTRAVYPYVQTIAEAQEIAELLSSAAPLTLQDCREPAQQESSQPVMRLGVEAAPSTRANTIERPAFTEVAG